jgi:hypothetical protein
MRSEVKVARKVWLTCAARRGPKNQSMPFTVGYLQRQARHGLGITLGEHRAAAAINELKRRHVLVPVGDYRSHKHGFRVTLYRVPPVTSSVRRTRVVKRRCDHRNWWIHPLFGTHDGRPPPGRLK